MAQQKDSISIYLQEQFNIYEYTNIDSSVYYAHQLIKHYSNISEDSLLLSTQQNLGQVYKNNSQIDSSNHYYNLTFKNLKISKYPFLRARYHLLTGDNYLHLSKFDEAIKAYETSFDVSNRYHFYKYATNSLVEIGYIYTYQGIYKKALEAFLKSDSIIDANNFKDLKSGSLLHISNIYLHNKQWDMAICMLRKSETLAIKENDIEGLYVVYNNLGTIHESKYQNKKALSYYAKALEYRKKSGDKKDFADIYHNLGSVNYELTNYNVAIDFLNKSLEIAIANNTKIDFIYNYEYLARVYSKLKDFEKSDDYLNKAINIANELNLTDKKVELAKFKTEYHFLKGEFDLAQKAFKKYDSLKEAFISKEKSERIIQMETLYEIDKKEKENDLLKAQNQLSQLNLEKEIQRKNQLFICFGISIVLLIFIIALMRRMSGANKTIKDFNIKLEESNKKLRLINSTKDKFFSIIAHDLRSPLGAILSFSNLIDDECSSSKEIETVAEYNSYLNQSARNLNSLLENLLQWSKSQLGSIKHLAIDFNLSEVIEENIEIQRLKAKEKSIEISFHIEQDIRVYADINMTNTVIRNLLSNAIKFSYPKSEINLFAKIDGKMLQLSVQDNGIGISQAQQDKLFKIESNTSTLGTNNETGTGLGLILCKEFVETNGGSIWIDSEEKKGANFTFTIPLQNS
ncbi:tetratricopeptide repeat protein [Ancylomarina sp. YFZ004]